MVVIIPPSDEYREKLLATRRNPRGRKLITADEVELAKRIEERRLSQGVTQQEIADLIGVHLNQANKYLRGQNKLSISKYVQICAFLQVAPGELLWGLDDVKTPELRDSPKRMLAMAQMFNAIEDQVKRDAIYSMIARVYRGEVEL
jgi:transcriptional regulator with XRE-family HTH domain